MQQHGKEASAGCVFFQKISAYGILTTIYAYIFGR
jgi:hypothetical protein